MTLARLSIALLTLALVVSGNGALAEGTAEAHLPTRPLNLSLPKAAVWSGMDRNEASARLSGREGSYLPELGASMDHFDAPGRLPYGSGYEARQRDSGSENSGVNNGSRGQGRGGMGRGR